MSTSFGLVIAQASSGGFSFPGGPTAILFAGVATLGLALLLFAILTFARRQERTDLREIHRALEDLRAGNPPRRADVGPGSPHAILAESVHRLAHEVTARQRESEAAEARLGALLEAAHDYAVVVTDADGDVRSFSRSAESLFGWEEEELQGRQAVLLFEEAAWKELLPKLSRRAFRDRGIEVRARLKRKNGSVFPARVSVRWVESPGSGPPGFLMLAKDVEDEVRLENELRESEARYRALFEGSADGILLIQNGTVLLANPAFGALAAAPAASLTNRPLRELIATRDMLVVEERLRLLEGEGSGTAEVRFTLLGADGRSRADVRMIAAAVRAGGGPAVLASIRDETAERLVEAELRGNEMRLDAVIEATSDGIVVVADTPSGGFVRLTNRAFLEIFGLEEGEVLGASEGDLLRLLRKRAGGAENVAAFLASATRGERTERITLEGERPRVLDLRAAALSGKGVLLGRVLACRDVTDQRAFEDRLTANVEALRASRAELEESHRKLQDVNEEIVRRAAEGDRLNFELKALVDMKTNLLATVSHELQTPLVSIRGYTEMILRERLGAINEEQRKGLTLSLQNIDRLIAMIDNLLSFSASTSDETIAPSVFPLHALVQESVSLLREQAARRGVAVEVAHDQPGILVRADRDKIHRVLVNLLSNGIKYNRDGGTLRVRTGPGLPGFVRVEVQDTGVGIPESEREKIFERGHRGTPAERTGRSGHGIGLAVVRDILRLHGCTIRVRSVEGQGATFEFSLPAAAVERQDETSTGQTTRDPQARSAPASASEPQETSPPSVAPPPSESNPGSPALRPRFRIIRNGSGQGKP